MHPDEPAKLNAQIYEEAAEWLIRCHTADLEEAARRAFDQWLRKSPEHQTAYMEIASIWSEGPALDSKRKWDANALVSQAAQEPANLLSWRCAAIARPSARSAHLALDLSQPPPECEASAQSSSRPCASPHKAAPLPIGAPSSFARWPLAAALVILPVGAGIGAWFAIFAPTTYATGIAEQRSIQLDDGSTLELNTRSKIAVHFSAHERDVTIVAGQALFHVAKDPLRPFVVTSSGTRVRAVGTEFDVYQKAADTIVTVVEGRVAVIPSTAHNVIETPQHDAPNGSAGVSTGAFQNFATQRSMATSEISSQASSASRTGAAALVAADDSRAILLSAGEQLTVTSNSVRRTEHPIVTRATAWTEHQLIFEFASLSEVVAEFNRYNSRPLVIAGSDLDNFHLSGVFSSTDLASLTQFLQDRLGLEIVETPTEIRIEKNNSFKR